MRTVAHARRIGFLLFNQIAALDVIGPMEAFSAACTVDLGHTEHPVYELVTLGLSGREVVSESGIAIRPNTTLAQCPSLDTLIVPGGEGLRETKTNTAISAWIKNRAGAVRRIASVCTGIYGLAPTGLLDHRKVTTHWRFARDVASRFPALQVDANALFLKDGSFYTSAGITAGIDLSLALIEEDLGQQVALRVARELVVYMKRPGGQEQYSEPLRFQVGSPDSTVEVATYIRAHLRRDLSVPALAEIAHLSTRQFSRRFKNAFQSSPAAYVEASRLDEARARLCETQCRIDHLAESVGFSSDDAFRRAFERRFGISPSHYRHHFHTGQSGYKPA
jgi:transcriptional regulator GlxA family with amidase domain